MNALTRHPKDYAKAQAFFIAEINRDVSLVWELFAPWRAEAIRKALQGASAALHEKSTKSRRSVHDHRENHIRADRPARASAARNLVGVNSIGQVAKLSMLDLLRVNGRAIGDVTAREARAWAASRRRDARFVELLTSNLPEDRPIREFRTGKDADALYARAQQEIRDEE